MSFVLFPQALEPSYNILIYRNWPTYFGGLQCGHQENSLSQNSNTGNKKNIFEYQEVYKIKGSCFRFLENMLEKLYNCTAKDLKADRSIEKVLRLLKTSIVGQIKLLLDQRISYSVLRKRKRCIPLLKQSECHSLYYQRGSKQ